MILLNEDSLDECIKQHKVKIVRKYWQENES